MSTYTAGEIAVWLVATALLGFVLGWLSREITHRARRRAPAALPQAPARSRGATPVDATPVDATPVDAEPEPEPEPEAEPDLPAEPAAAPVVEPGKHPGSAKPLAGGAPPAERFTVKGNEKSMIYHAPGSPSYDRTQAQTWFETEEAAVAAGFRKPKNA